MTTSGRSVLVTGGSRGIGAAVARRFAAAGDRVAVHHRDASSHAAADAIAASLAGDGHAIVAGDLADSAAVEAMVEDAAQQLGGLDVVVNSAGVSIFHAIDGTTYEAWQEVWRTVIGVNLLGPANVAWCAVPHLVAAGGGRIVNVASRGAFRGEPNQPAYGASKAALVAFSQSLAVALGPHRIAVSAVAPGWTDTDMVSERLTDGRRAEVEATIPLGRINQPAEVAAAVFYLASAEAELASGSVIDVNGASFLRM